MIPIESLSLRHFYCLTISLLLLSFVCFGCLFMWKKEQIAHISIIRKSHHFLYYLQSMNVVWMICLRRLRVRLCVIFNVCLCVTDGVCLKWDWTYTHKKSEPNEEYEECILRAENVNDAKANRWGKLIKKYL